MRTSRTFKILFWQNTAKKNGAHAPIYARVTVNGKRSEISLGQSCPIAFWDTKMSRVVGRTIEARELNYRLDNIKINISSAFEEILKEGKYITAQAVKSRYLGTDNHDATLLDIITYHEEKMQGSLEKGTLKNYRTTEKYLRSFLAKKMNSSNIYLEQLSYRFVVDFERFLRDKTNNLSKQALRNNGIMKHIERLNKLMNLAVKLEWLDRNPFRNYCLKFDKFDRPFLTDSELERFEFIELDKITQSKARDLFVFACYTGLSYIDVKNLTAANLVYGMDGKKWLSLYREKSKKPVKLPLLEKAQRILDKYENYDISDKLLPMYSNQKVNKYVKEIAVLCGIEKNLSFHAARHTFATTVTLSNGVPIETVSKLLGHSKLSTTQIYARVVEDKLGNDIELLQERLNSNRRSAAKSQKC